MTMTPEKRAAMRAKVEASYPFTNGEWIPEAEFANYARTALPAALDALDLLEEALTGANMIGVKVTDEREHWKTRAEAETKRADEAEARAEALERAVTHKEPCYACTGIRCFSCDMCYCNFQFDAARFTPAT